MMVMMRHLTVAVLAAALLVPAGAMGQTPDRITILDNLGTYKRGDGLFVFGVVANPDPNAFLIMQITNPVGNLCQIQQLTPLSNGAFMTEPIPLSGGVCGIEGTYDIALFYGENERSSSFVVAGVASGSDAAQMTAAARLLVDTRIKSIGDGAGLDQYKTRLGSASTLDDLESIYVDLWDRYRTDSGAMDEIAPAFRPAVRSALDSNANLLESGKISAEISRQIDHTIHSAIFHHGVGNTNRAVLLINDAFIQVKNADPIKAQPRQLSFSDLEDTLLKLMQKTDTVLSSKVREEVAFILARGTAPLFAEDITALVDMLTKSRYLDVISRKDTSLYRLVNSQWDTLRGSMSGADSIEDLLSSRSHVDDLHAAALLLRQLDRVDRFIRADEDEVENSDLALIIRPEWNLLESRLSLASSPQDIIDAGDDIRKMRDIIEISSRLVKLVDIARQNDINARYVDQWESLLADVRSASSPDEILRAVSAFDASITELREKRSPLSSLKFEFEQLRQKAELQADYENLHTIRQALLTIKSVEQLQQRAGSQQQQQQQVASKLDRAEVLLTWASQIAPSIRADLESSEAKFEKTKASEILQRAKSIENLAQLSLTKSRFLPGFTDFVESIDARVDKVRALVIAKDLAAADTMVRDLFAEWRTVTAAYENDPKGSPVGYSLDELQRIEYRERLDDYSSVVGAFSHSGFTPHASGYNNLVTEANDLMEYGNFIDSETRIDEIGRYLEEHLVLSHPSIVYDISYDHEKDIWVISGAVQKSVTDRRENLYLTVYDTLGHMHSSLEFTDGRQGEFFTLWNAPTEPGLYVVMLQFQNIRASQLVNIEDKTERIPRPGEVGTVDLSREFEEIKSFLNRFGGPDRVSDPIFASLISSIKSALEDRNPDLANSRIDSLERLIERHLPVRDRTAVIETQYNGKVLVISGAVKKSLAFSEDLYIDIFDRRGDLVRSISLKDNTAGLFSESMSLQFEPGIYVAQLQYHELTVTDFFTVR